MRIKFATTKKMGKPNSRNLTMVKRSKVQLGIIEMR